MDSSQEDDVLSVKSDENLSAAVAIPDVTLSTNPRTVREFDTEFQELKRENFNLKLRIFFLEEQSTVTLDNKDTSSTAIQRRRALHTSPIRHGDLQQTSNNEQSSKESDQDQQTSSVIRRQQETQVSAIRSTDESDELQQLKLELERCRKESSGLRKLLRDSGEIGENIRLSTVGQNTQTFTTVTSDTAMPVSQYTVQFNERERKLQEENNLLKQETASLRSKLTEVNNSLEQLNEKYKEEQIKSERVLRRLKADYDTRISTLEGEHQKKLAVFESYRHEPLLARIRFTYPLQEQTGSDGNCEEHLRTIRHQGCIIKKLEAKIQELTERPLPLSTSSHLTEENSQSFNEKLEPYIKIIENLRAECNELRRSEAYLRTQVANLIHILNPSTSTSDLPPLPRPSPSIATETHQNPEAAVAQVTVQLRNVADDVSGLTNRISKIKRDYDDSQTTIRKQEIQIREYEAHLTEIEKEMKDQFGFRIETLEQEKNNLRIQIDERDRRSREITNDIARMRLESQQVINDLETQYTRETQNLQEQNQRLTERIRHFQEELDKEQQTNNDLRRDYENLQQKAQIENYAIEFREMETSFQEERFHLQRERDFERKKVNEIQIELNNATTRSRDLQTQYDQSQLIIVEQQKKIENQSLNVQSQIAQLAIERDNLDNQVQMIKHDKQTVENRLYEYETKLTKLTQLNNELNERIIAYETHSRDINDDKKRYQTELNIVQHDNHNVIQRYQNELSTLQRDNQNAIERYETLQRERTDWEKKYHKVLHDKEVLERGHRQSLTELQTLKKDNFDLRHELDRLEIRIRLEISQEYEQDYRKRYSQISDDLGKEKEILECTLQEKTNEIARFERQLQTLQNELQEANTIIQSYENDIEHWRSDLRRAEEVNKQIELDVSRQYTSQLNTQKDRIQKLENQNQAYETQIAEYKQQFTIVPNNIDQLEKELREKEILIQKRQDDLTVVENERKDTQTQLEIRIQQLEKDLQTKEEFIQTHIESLNIKDQHIEKLLEDIKRVDNPNSSTIETLHQDLVKRERRIDELLNEKTSITQEYERYISELKLNIQDCKRRFTQTNDQLQEAEQKIDALQFEIDELTRRRNSLDFNLNIALEDKETHLDRIRNLEQQLEMAKKTNGVTPSDQRNQYQSIIDDLNEKFKQRENLVQNLQNSLHHSNEELNNLYQAHNKLQSDYNRITLRNERMEKQLKSDVENRDQLIATLRQNLSEREREINKLHEINIENGKKINKLHSKFIEMEPNFESIVSDERTSTNAALQIEIQRKDQKKIIKHLHIIDYLLAFNFLIYINFILVQSNYEHLSREELLYELEMSLQHNEELNEQLKNKFPTITELHKQLVEIRHELSRQKYVNQVLWRKLNALIDIHGSNTRAELAVELANYQDELAKLKLQQSQQNFCSLHNGMLSTSIELPTKNIKSTIALLERSNIEWQTKLARLTEQLGRSENQSRNYHRELIKYQNVLYEAGLIESCIRQRRRSADDSVIMSRNESNKINNDVTEIDNINELKEIIRNQRKFIQQLQMRVRTNTPDIIQSPTIDKLQQQIQNLNLVIETYKDESNLLKIELKKLYKTIEHSRKTQQNYEKIFREQQTCIEQSKKKLNKYEQFFKKYDTHLPIFDERKEHIIDQMDEYIIDLDIDILQGNDTKKKTSVNKRDSALSNATDTNDFQRQIHEKDEQIRILNNDINRKGEQIQELTTKLTNLEKVNEDAEYRHRIECDRIRQDFTGGSRKIENQLQEARLQIDSLKTFKIQFDQSEEKNQRLNNEIQRLKDEIKRLKDEVKRNESVIDHYKTQITILERKPVMDDNDTSEISIRKNELSQLLQEMRLLRRDLERSIEKQKELQARLDDNIRQSRSPRSFTFSGRGVSYPDLRVLDASGVVGAENLSSSIMIDEKFSKPIASSTSELEQVEYAQQSFEEIVPRISMRQYIVGESKIHDDLRRLIQDIRIDLKALAPHLQDQLRSKTDTAIRSLEEHLNQLDKRLTHVLDLIETYWKADLPEKNQYNEHIFIDHRLMEEKISSRYSIFKTKISRTIKSFRTTTRSINFQPTLDVLQKARSNIEHHLKESNTNNIPPGSAQTHRRHRSNRKD
ncbi:unnamed protein product [Rotaria sp. Silwood1]|nr:unnamed protein product [Rotaria sp. Silwood1]